jgi:uncharacterized protein YqeY
MALIDQAQKDMVAAMKNREEARLSAIRIVKAALMEAKVASSCCDCSTSPDTLSTRPSVQ